jgi:RNA ligase (TIGR02306 family)
VARLRGQPSYGLIAETGVLPPRPDGLAWGPGDSVVEALGLSKWEPPITCTDGDALPDHPGFPRYYGMENWRNFPDLFQDGEEVAITEKVHGKNCRFGLVRDAGEDGSMSWTWMAGSHDVRRKETATRRKKKRDPETGEEAVAEWQEKPVFWQALDLPGIRVMMEAISARQRSVVVFGEIYGSGVQDMAYGYEGGRWHFRAFDIMVDGQYLGVKDKLHWLHTFAVPTVPFLYHGPYSAARVEELVDGPTTVPGGGTVGGAVHGFAGREGVVITSAVERAAATASHVHQRAVLKAVSFAYLERKNPDPTEDH